MAKLRGRPKTTSDETIAEIYRLYDTGDYGYLMISKMLGVSQRVVFYWIKQREKNQTQE